MIEGSASPPLSADWFRQLAETTASCIFVFQRDRMVYVNPATCELTGYSEAELLALGPDDLVHPDDRELVRRRRSDRLEGADVPRRYEFRLLTKSGGVRWILFTAGLIHWGGEPAGLGTAIDITERKRAEEALAERLRLEQALAAVARRFVHVPEGDMAAAAADELARFAGLLGVDRARLFLFSGDGSTARVVAQWPPDEEADESGNFLTERYPWGMSRLRRRETLLVTSRDDMPSEAEAERRFFAGRGIASAVSVPLWAGGRLVGFLAFDSNAPRSWAPDGVALLEVLAEVLAGAFERQRAELALRSSQERLELAQRVGRSIVWEWDVGSDEMELSAFAMELFGASPADVPKSGDELMRFIPAEDQAIIHEALRRSLRERRPYLLEHRIVSPGGEARWLAVRGQVLPAVSGEGPRILGVSADVTEHKRAEEALYEEQERAAVTLASIGDGVVRTDAAGRVDYMNQVAEALTGYTLAEARGRPLGEVYRVVDELSRQPRIDPVARCLAEDDVVVLPGRSLLLSRRGDEFAIRDSAAPVRDRRGDVVGAVLVCQDVTQLRGLEREMSFLARHDPLTGLINRREFERQLAGALEEAREEARHHALCYLDLDDFKVVNDTCGHVAGDELLRQLTALLASQVREGDALARLGGDEFGVLLRDCPRGKGPEVAAKLCATVRQFRFAWEEKMFDTGVSIGVVPLDGGSGSLAQVLSAADAACYVAKDQGGNRVHLYEPDDRAVAHRYGEMRWVQRIKESFERGRFRLVVQPIHRLADLPLDLPPGGPDAGPPPMAEILLRMVDEDGRPHSTPSFIAAAERYHLMHDIDRWVVRRSLAAIAGDPGPTVYTVNLSGQSLGESGFLDYVLAELAASPVPGTRLCFEITETATITNLARARRFIAALKERGCRFVLDDFGTGLSSFAYLKTLAVDYLKIDGEFVRHLASDPVQRALVESINSIGQLIGLATIAEAVETDEALAALRGIGVDYVQGFRLGRPAGFSGWEAAAGAGAVLREEAAEPAPD